MKNIYYLLGCFLLLVACENLSEDKVPQATPEEAAKGFVTALKEQDFERARQFGTKESQKSVLDFETNLKMVNEEEKKELLAGFNIEISKVDCSEEQGVTSCNLCCSPEGGEATLELVKRNDKWFVKTELGF